MKRSNKKISNLKGDFRKTKLGNFLLKVFFVGLIVFILAFIAIFVTTLISPEYDNIYFVYMILSIIGCSTLGIVTGLYVGALKEYIEENK